MKCLLATVQKCNHFGVEVHFRIKGIRVPLEIFKTFKGKLSNGGLHTHYFYPYNKLLCSTHLNIPFLSSRSMEFWTPTDNEQKSKDQRVSKGLRCCCRCFPGCLFIVRNLTPSSFSVIHPFCPCQDEVAPCF